MRGLSEVFGSAGGNFCCQSVSWIGLDLLGLVWFGLVGCSNSNWKKRSVSKSSRCGSGWVVSLQPIAA